MLSWLNGDIPLLLLSVNSLHSRAELILLRSGSNPKPGHDLAQSGQTVLDMVLIWPRFGPEMVQVPSRDGCSPKQRPSLALSRRLSHKGRPCREQWTIHLCCRDTAENKRRARPNASDFSASTILGIGEGEGVNTRYQSNLFFWPWEVNTQARERNRNEDNGGGAGRGGGGCRVWTQKEAGLIAQIGDLAELRLAVKGNREGQQREEKTCQLHTQLMLNLKTEAELLCRKEKALNRTLMHFFFIHRDNLDTNKGNIFSARRQLWVKWGIIQTQASSNYS